MWLLGMLKVWKSLGPKYFQLFSCWIRPFQEEQGTIVLQLCKVIYRNCTVEKKPLQKVFLFGLWLNWIAFANCYIEHLLANGSQKMIAGDFRLLCDFNLLVLVRECSGEWKCSFSSWIIDQQQHPQKDFSDENNKFKRVNKSFTQVSFVWAFRSFCFATIRPTRFTTLWL